MHSLRTAFLPFLLLFILAPGLPAHAAGAGVVTEWSGKGGILSADGKTHPLRKGATLEQGDAATTGDEGRVSLRFKDGTVVHLQPHSHFRVDEYAYAGKNDREAKSIFTLLKGGLRTLTGMIGKLNRPGYAVRTTAATIGIRGTEYTATLNKGLRVDVHGGEISLTNRSGSFSVAEGQSAFVADENSAPRYLGAGNRAESRANQIGSGVKIQGNTHIDASTRNTTAVASGSGNTASNQTGVIGGD